MVAITEEECTHACMHPCTCTDKIVQSWSVASPTGFLKCWKLLRVTWGSGTGRVCASDCTCVSGSEYWAPDKSTSSDFLLFFPSCPFGPTLSCYDESQKVKRSQVPWCQGQIGGESRTCKACVVHTARTCSCRRLHKCVWLSKDFEKQSVVSPSHKLYHNFTKTATAQPSRCSDIYTNIWFPSFQKAFTTQKTKLLVFFYTRILRYIHILYTHPHKKIVGGASSSATRFPGTRSLMEALCLKPVQTTADSRGDAYQLLAMLQPGGKREGEKTQEEWRRTVTARAEFRRKKKTALRWQNCAFGM